MFSTVLVLHNDVNQIMSLLDFNQKQQRNNVYLCGFLTNRLHNEQLYSISRELMLPFFVCTNPTSGRKWNKKETSNLMSQCDVMVFWLNRYTLNDRNCLLSLQLAWELNLHVIMLRHPRMRLVVNPLMAQGKDNTDLDESTAPNMTFLQYAIVEGYKQSIEYDRNSHLLSMQRLIAKIFSGMESKYANSTRESSPTSGSTDTYPETKEFLKLPNLSPMYSFSENDNRRASTISHIMARSRSQDNVKVNPMVMVQVPMINGFTHKNGKAPLLTRRDSSLPRIITLKKSRTVPIEDFTKHANSLGLPPTRNTFLSSSPDLRRESFSAAMRSTNDPELYHDTQYLVFPMMAKNHKPRLIHFPMDVINSKEGDDMELESAWGSDSGEDENMDMATKLQGDLLISSPPRTPAPYIDPL